MVYIILLNWNNATDTISCLKSISSITDVQYKVVICDNLSADNSYNDIREFLTCDENYKHSFSEYTKHDVDGDCDFSGKKTALIQNGANLGFAGGNNVGINFALLQSNMNYVWLLNNDTEVQPSSLSEMIARFEDNKKIGVCGSKLVYYHQRDRIQGLGGIINPVTCATRHYPWLESSDKEFNDNAVELKIDYVLGASMLFSRVALEKAGLLCEDYFLYYEEVDICNRLKQSGFSIGVASKSIVYHKEGASTGHGKSDIADFCSVKNRLLIAKKFYPKYILTVKFSLLGVIFNRLRRREYSRAIKYLKFFII